MFSMEMARLKLICSTASSNVSFQSSGRACVFNVSAGEKVSAFSAQETE